MKKIISVLVAFVAVSALAQTPENIKAHGQIDVTVHFGKKHFLSGNIHNKTEAKRTHAKLEIQYWGEGKVRGKLAIDSTHPCVGDTMISMVGIDKGLGEIEVYAKNADLLKEENSIGSIVIYQDSVTFSPAADRTFNLLNSKGQFCNMIMRAATQYEFFKTRPRE